MRIVLGPPGTGKTTRLLGIVEDALQRGVDPRKIGYFSFTKKAATEAMERACVKFDAVPADFPYFRTLHSLAFNCLGLNSSAVLNGKRMTEFGHLMGLELSGKTFDPIDGVYAGATLDDRLIFLEQHARTLGCTLDEAYEAADLKCNWYELQRVAAGVAKFKEVRGLVDFTDMLYNVTDAHSLLPKLDLLVIDEAQDLSRAQWLLVEALVKKARETWIAGDDDQAIFKWAGADVEYFIRREGEVEVLDKSWRLPRRIAEVAMKVIKNIGVRREKVWHPRDAEGAVSLDQSISHIDMSQGSWLVLARNRFLLSALEADIEEKNVFYSVLGKPCVDSDILKAKNNGKPFEATAREVQYINSLEAAGEDLTKEPRILLSTIHGAKGGEADNVILCSDASRVVAEHNHTADEARVTYVGVTRARESLHILESRTRFTLFDNFDIMLK